MGGITHQDSRRQLTLLPITDYEDDTPCGNKDERQQREPWDGEDSEALPLDRAAADADRTLSSWRKLEYRVVGRNADSQSRQRESRLPDRRPIFKGRHAENHDERIHQDALVPAEWAWRKVGNLAKVETPYSRYNSDERTARKQSTTHTDPLSDDCLKLPLDRPLGPVDNTKP